jgi:hypothetical protein
MTEPVTESYEINTGDSELHAISVMLEALKRHVDRSQDNPNCEENIIEGHKAMIRCARYILEKVGGA